MKKLIICINNNKVLTLTALILGVLVGIFGSATGWFAVISGIITGAAVLVIENLRRAYNETYSWEPGKRWMLLAGMGISVSAIISGFCSIVFNPTESLGIFTCLAAILITIATAWTLVRMAWENHSLSDGKVSLIIWAVLLGIVGLMATACYALIVWMLGTSAADLLHDDVIIYGGGISLALIAIFIVAILIVTIAFLWDKLVKWAQR